MAISTCYCRSRYCFARFFLSQGVIQNFNPYTEVTTLEGAKQVIAQGPAASFTVMKVLGSNGGGFFNSNGAHPFDNPTPLTNFVQMFLILLIPSAIIYQFGHPPGSVKHAWTVWAAVAFMFIGGTLVCGQFETSGNPAYTAVGCASSANWEGKEARFGIFNSSLYAVATTDSSCGSVNSVHDSFTPMGGLVLLLNLVMGEVIYGGVGSGLYGLVDVHPDHHFHHGFDGRAHARVPRQINSIERNQIRHAGPGRDDVSESRACWPGHVWIREPGPDLEIRRCMDFPRCSTTTLRRP